MMSGEPLIVRNAEIGGRAGQDVRIAQGRIADIGPRLAGSGQDLDARGGALIPGLIDHHIHLLGAAARADSLAADRIETAAAFAAAMRDFAAGRPEGAWLRVTGYHEATAGLLDRRDLDRLAPSHPVRVQHRTGGLWMLNSRALALVIQDEAPSGLERDAFGAPTGRLWREDAWLRRRIHADPPALAPIGRALAAAGVTGVTDASVTTDADAAALLAGARRAGDLPQRLHLMSGGPLETSDDGAYSVGPLKILIDDHNLPPLDELIGRIALARALGRRVAVHCVAAGELALTLAAFEAAGARPGDRIEHGGVIAEGAIEPIARLGLTVVTQSSFVFERGDRYLAEVDPAEQGDLYRCASLIAAGVPVAGSSDAPYGGLDPWRAIRAAVDRRTRAGRALGPAEAVSARRALGLYLGDFANPGGPARRIAPGAPADLCLLRTPLADALRAPEQGLVSATVIGGRLAFPAP